MTEQEREETARMHAQAEMNGRLLTENAELREENAKLRDLLKPFAGRFDDIEKSSPKNLTNCDCAIVVNIDHLRAAAAAIREGGKGDGKNS